MELGKSEWFGAGGPAYYLQAEDETVVAILYWTDVDIATAKGEELSVIDAGWNVVFTDNGDSVDLPDGVSLSGPSDEEQVEAIESTIKAAERLLEAD